MFSLRLFIENLLSGERGAYAATGPGVIGDDERPLRIVRDGLRSEPFSVEFVRHVRPDRSTSWRERL